MFDMPSITKYGVLLTKRGLLLNLIFSAIFYVSYFVFFVYVPRCFIQSAGDLLMAQASFNVIIAITLIIASFLINRINKLRTVYACLILTSTLSVFLLFFSNIILRIVFISMIAVPFSVGQLAFLAYFWSLTVPEERGRVGGSIGFFSLLLHLIVYTTVATSLDFNSAVLLGMILSLGAFSVILLRPEKAVLTKKKGERGKYSEKRTIILYSVPWILFSLINATFAKNISFQILQQVPSSLYLFLTVLQAGAAIFGMLSGGLVADFFGRRVSLAFSLTLYGISSALAGIAGSFTVLYFVYITNGLSWGILIAMYSFVVWGDLANKENSAKMYAIGFIVFYVAQGIGLLPIGQMLQTPLIVSALVSCLLIFLSNIPIFLAPELLPSEFRERIQLKFHINAIKKIRQSRNQG
jgi:hypothetical protein